MKIAETFLRSHLQEEFEEYWGKTPKTLGLIEQIVYAWLNDNSNSEKRYFEIKKYLPHAKKILDMAAGCGTFVYYGLIHGYDVVGIEPEQWKLEFNKLKAKENKYPLKWMSRFISSVGEKLPFDDSTFDCVSTYQTLEHVKNVQYCIREMVRVVKPGGGLHIKCPDYRSTYEGHYLLPWLPLMPKSLAKIYLSILGRPQKGLKSLHYITSTEIIKTLQNIKDETNRKIRILDINHESAVMLLKKRKLPSFSIFTSILKIIFYCLALFRRELSTNLFVIIDE